MRAGRIFCDSRTRFLLSGSEESVSIRQSSFPVPCFSPFQEKDGWLHFGMFALECEKEVS